MEPDDTQDYNTKFEFHGKVPSTTMEAASKLPEVEIGMLDNLLRTQMSKVILDSLIAALTKADGKTSDEPSTDATEIVKSFPTSFAVTYRPRQGRELGGSFITVDDKQERDLSGRESIRRTATIPTVIWLKPDNSLDRQMKSLWRTEYGPVCKEVNSRLDAFAYHADADNFLSPYINKCDASLVLRELTMRPQSIPEGWQSVALTDKEAQAKWSVSDATKVGLGIVGWGGHTGGFLAPLTVYMWPSVPS
jgi:hypothetical protein